MNSRRKVIILILLFVALGFGVKEAIRKYPDVKADFLEQLRRDEIYKMSGVDKVDGNSHARIDALMAFVHNNSVHHIDDEFWSDFKNKPRSLDKMIAFVKGESTAPPHMECSTRSKLLLPLLQKAGYEVRMIDMFKYKPEYNSHVVVEVKNKETGNWEVYDPHTRSTGRTNARANAPPSATLCSRKNLPSFLATMKNAAAINAKITAGRPAKTSGSFSVSRSS